MRIVVDVRGGNHGPVFRSIQERHDPDTRGGAPLLGLSRPVIINPRKYACCGDCEGSCPSRHCRFTKLNPTNCDSS